VSPSVRIQTRRKGNGERRFHVKFRVGGRATPEEHGGAFRSLREAQARERFIRDEIAAGRHPLDTLAELKRRDPRGATLAEWMEAWLNTRVDITSGTRADYRGHLAPILAVLGREDPTTFRVADAQGAVGILTEASLSPASVRLYFSTFRQVLDFVGLDPNPARSKAVRLPRVEREVPNVPSGEHVAAMLRCLSPRYQLAFVLIEQTGLRVGELAALTWGDVDAIGSRLRVYRGKTRAARRMAVVPPWLMSEVERLLPREDRQEGAPVFRGFERRAAATALARACKAAGVPHYHPHELRHRFASLQIARNVPRTEIAAQLGHSRISQLDVYAHVILNEQVEPWLAVLAEPPRYLAEFFEGEAVRA
jgi:integrase